MGCIYDDRGHKMTPSHVRMRGIKYRYYISTALLQGQAEQAGTVSRIPADEIQALVVKCVRGHLNESTDIENAILGPIGPVGHRARQCKRCRSQTEAKPYVIECLGTRHHQPGAAKFSRPKPDRFRRPPHPQPFDLRRNRGGCDCGHAVRSAVATHRARARRGANDGSGGASGGDGQCPGRYLI